MEENKPIDMTATHSQQFTDAQGKKHIVVKPIKVERIPNAQGGFDVKVTLPRLSMRPQMKP
jgi:hypothetical protein